MTVVMLVPRRADGGRRDQLWRFVRDWWTRELPDLKIIEGHHDDGPFNRSAAINVAADQAGDWDIAVIADADVVTDPAQLAAAIDLARATGRCTLAYTNYAALREQITEDVLAGYDGDWSKGARLKMTNHVSSLVAVPRRLWDEVDGFDERFVGWGHEDLAFAAACRVLGGGIERIPGTVWHLWHADTAERNPRSLLLHAGQLLANRYHATLEPDAMRLLCDEKRGSSVALVVVTDGRRGCIEPTIANVDRLHGLPVMHRIISDDSADPDYQAWLRLTFPGWQIVTGRKRRGFAGAVRAARDAAVTTGAPWLFFLEDDFVCERDVDLAAMAAVLERNPHLVQMALRRQAWFPNELTAGGVIEQHPDAYTDHDANGQHWLEHDLFFTTNPHLIARSTVVAHEWPDKPHSESLYARQVLRDGRRSGYWGARTDEPWVTHIGDQRVGMNY